MESVENLEQTETGPRHVIQGTYQGIRIEVIAGYSIASEAVHRLLVAVHRQAATRRSTCNSRCVRLCGRAALAALASASIRATSGIARSRSPRRCLGRPSPHNDHGHHCHDDGQGDQGQMAAPSPSIWFTLLLMKIRQLLKLGGAGV